MAAYYGVKNDGLHHPGDRLHRLPGLGSAPRSVSAGQRSHPDSRDGHGANANRAGWVLNVDGGNLDGTRRMLELSSLKSMMLRTFETRKLTVLFRRQTPLRHLSTNQA